MYFVLYRLSCRLNVELLWYAAALLCFLTTMAMHAFHRSLHSLKCHSMRFFWLGKFLSSFIRFFSPDFRSCYYWIRKIWNKSQLSMHSKVKLEIAQYTFILDLQTCMAALISSIIVIVPPLQILFGTNIMQVKANDKISTPQSNQNHYLYPSVILFCILQ